MKYPPDYAWWYEEGVIESSQPRSAQFASFIGQALTMFLYSKIDRTRTKVSLAQDQINCPAHLETHIRRGEYFGSDGGYQVGKYYMLAQGYGMYEFDMLHALLPHPFQLFEHATHVLVHWKHWNAITEEAIRAYVGYQFAQPVVSDVRYIDESSLDSNAVDRASERLNMNHDAVATAVRAMKTKAKHLKLVKDEQNDLAKQLTAVLQKTTKQGEVMT